MRKTRWLWTLMAFVAALPAYGVDFSALLPANRSVQVGSQTSFFGTMLNTSSSKATNCAIFLATPIDAWFSYQATNAETNAPIGLINTPVSIAANSSQSFVLTLTPNSVIAPIDVRFTYSCDGKKDVADIDGVNTLLFSASSQPVPDVVALASTVTANGIVELVQGETGFFTLSSTNLGISGAFIVTPRVTGNESISVSICQTDSNTSVCLADPQPTVNVVIDDGETPTFALFLTADDLIELDAAEHRVFVEFRDGSDEVRGSTSVAVLSSQRTETTPGPPPEPAPPPVTERTVTVTWQAPEQNDALLSAYGIHFGSESGNYTKSVLVDPQESAKDITVSTGTLFIAMTSESTAGNRSNYSAELEVLIQ